jgi:signal transduction histidine kinase
MHPRQALANLGVARAEKNALITRDPLPTLRVDRARFIQLFQNLIGNALKYGDAARLKLEQRERGAVLILDDDGPGIPEAAQEAVFQPFPRVEGSRNRETGGTGLGLTIARSILRAHGGDVTLRNRREGGLQALITLPAAS